MTVTSGQPFISIDGGNSRLKVTLFPAEYEGHPDIRPEVRCFASGDTENLMEWVEEICGADALPECAMATVGHVDTRLAESLRKRLGDERFLLVTPGTPLPITMRYTTPRTLGLDRKAAACGGVALRGGESLLIIDAGTALTIDRINENGEFMGGNISPGLMMRFRALHDFTAALPMITEPARDFSPTGTDTRTAIIAGAEGGWLDEVRTAIYRGVNTGVKRVLVCGGDAELLKYLLEKEPTGVVIEHFPHLVAVGLRMIYIANK
ncbi:MAG: type III pantothenate kinase [Muribaculaceae bacterium]|nr:type III pantothenate kinase [Muribaculaceae bacterium]